MLITIKFRKPQFLGHIMRNNQRYGLMKIILQWKTEMKISVSRGRILLSYGWKKRSRSVRHKCITSNKLFHIPFYKEKNNEFQHLKRIGSPKIRIKSILHSRCFKFLTDNFIFNNIGAKVKSKWIFINFAYRYHQLWYLLPIPSFLTNFICTANKILFNILTILYMTIFKKCIVLLYLCAIWCKMVSTKHLKYNII